MPSPWIAVSLVLVVFILAMVLRRQSGTNESAVSVVPPMEEPDPEPEVSTDEDGEIVPEERVPVTAEGVALMRVGHQVVLLSMVQSEEIPDWLSRGIGDSSVSYDRVNELYGAAAPATKLGATLSAGDFTAARLRRDPGGWRIETLGRDGDFGFFPFETEAGARLALDLLQHLEIIQVYRDDELGPIPPSAEDFEEARRRYEETEQALALENDPGEGWSPGEHSDRR